MRGAARWHALLHLAGLLIQVVAMEERSSLRWPLRGAWLLQGLPAQGKDGEKDLQKALRADLVEDRSAVALVACLTIAACVACALLASLNLEDPDVSPPPRPEGWPLTKQLVVPTGRLFLFRIPSVVHTGRQSRCFDILDPRGEAVCRVTMDEQGHRSQPAQIRLETKLEGKLLASVNTDDAFTSSSSGGSGEDTGETPELVPEAPPPPPKVRSLGIYKADGTKFASISMERGRYVVRRAGEHLLTCYGDFRRHHIQMLDLRGRKAAVVQPDVDGYTGHVAPDEDAGLVLCVLLAVDKLEQLEDGGAGAAEVSPEEPRSPASSTPGAGSDLNVDPFLQAQRGQSEETP